MNTLKFKSTIKCTGCLANVTPFLNDVVGQNNWEVDLKNPDKILSVQSEGISEEEIKNAVEKAGYKAETIAK